LAFTLAGLIVAGFQASTLWAEPLGPYQAAGPIGAPAEGGASVSAQTGAFSYNVPIVVPPGRLGMQPALSLDYSSQSPLFGGIASGWSLSIPSISWDYSMGTDTPGLPRWTSSLAGRLIRTDEPPLLQLAYRGRYDDSQARYIYNAFLGEWQVLRKDGSQLRFGESSRMEQTFPDWKPLTSIIDRFGNAVYYHWSSVTDTATGQVVGARIDRIEYTVNAGAGLDAHAEVRFQWGTPNRCHAQSLPIGAQLDYRSGSRRIWGYLS
jgi:hypothetical protein